MLIIVLLKVDFMWAMPCGTFFFTFFRPLDLPFVGLGNRQHLFQWF
jgi:hypothetical protein